MAIVTEITLNNKTNVSKSKIEDAKKLIEANYKEDSRPVKGIFKNLEVPGGEVVFHYRKYPQDALCIYEFKDGGEYTIPLGVAKHINITCNEKGYKYIRNLDGDLLKTPKIYPNRQRYQFLSSEYM